MSILKYSQKILSQHLVQVFLRQVKRPDHLQVIPEVEHPALVVVVGSVGAEQALVGPGELDGLGRGLFVHKGAGG